MSGEHQCPKPCSIQQSSTATVCDMPWPSYPGRTMRLRERSHWMDTINILLRQLTQMWQGFVAALPSMIIALAIIILTRLTPASLARQPICPCRSMANMILDARSAA